MDPRESIVASLAAACSWTSLPAARAHGALEHLGTLTPYAAAMVTYVEPGSGEHRPLAAAGYPPTVSRYLLTDFVAHDPGYARVCSSPDEPLCWQSLPGYDRSFSPRQVFRPNGFREGTSLCLRDDRDLQVGAVHVSVRQKAVSDRWLACIHQLRPLFSKLSAVAGERAACRLSVRETEVLELLAHGLSNAEIAAELVLSRRTVATHVEHILHKLGSHSRAHVAARAVALGLIDPT